MLFDLTFKLFKFAEEPVRANTLTVSSWPTRMNHKYVKVEVKYLRLARPGRVKFRLVQYKLLNPTNIVLIIFNIYNTKFLNSCVVKHIDSKTCTNVYKGGSIQVNRFSAYLFLNYEFDVKVIGDLRTYDYIYVFTSNEKEYF